MNAKTRLINWGLDSGFIYKRTVSYFVTELQANDNSLTSVSTLGSLVAGSFYYDPVNSELFVWLPDNSNPEDSEMVVTYRLFYSNVPISLPWDLSDSTEEDVYYDGRILQNPGYKFKIGIEQNLTSTVGSGNLKLENNDGALDEIFDKFIFENQVVEIYSYNRDLSSDQAQIIFRGRITNKSYTEQEVAFTVKDQIFDLQQNVPQNVFTASDNVNEDTQGNYKRWLYGKVDGLKLQSVDQIGDGYAITGTVSINTSNNTMVGSGTIFLTELSPQDTILIETQRFTIESVDSDTSATLSSVPTYSINGAAAILTPAIPVVNKNRDFFVADHACALLTKQVVNALQFNRIILNDTIGLEAGDFVEFTGGVRREIKNVAPGNVIVLRQNVPSLPAIGSDVTRQPVQQVFIEGQEVDASDYAITTNSTETKITLEDDAEFNVAPLRDLNLSMTFTNGSRTITYAGTANLTEIFEPRDYIRPNNISYTTFYEILAVQDTQIIIRTNFTDPTITDIIEAKQPTYVGDDTIVSCNSLGKTKDGTPSGEWIRTSADVVEDLLNEINLTAQDSASFLDVSTKVSQLVSLAIPRTPGDSTTTVKAAIDIVNRSTRCALTVDKDLNLKYESVLISSPEEFVVISDSDVVNWKIKSTNGNNYRNAIIKYRHQDIINATLESGNRVKTHSSTFVERYVGTNKTFEEDFYIYEETAAQIAAEREVYYNSLGRSEITIESDLRLENIEIGDLAVLDFERLYKRFGDETTRRKLVTCVGKNVTGEKVVLEFSDYGNTYNTSAYVTDNAANDFSLSDSDDKIKNGYITDSKGIVNTDENTNKINLIS